ncbi:MAG: universal stress protein, partial [Anaerolineae bacterium]
VPLDEVLAQDTPLARHLASCVSRLEIVGLGADDVMVRHGAVPDVIFEEARAGAFDMIVVGSRAGYHRDSYFIGSITDRVVKHAHRSVLVVRTTPD